MTLRLALFVLFLAHTPLFAATERFQVQGWTTVNVGASYATVKEACREANRVAVATLRAQCERVGGTLEATTIKALGDDEARCSITAAAVCVADLSS